MNAKKRKMSDITSSSASSRKNSITTSTSQKDNLQMISSCNTEENVEPDECKKKDIRKFEDRQKDHKMDEKVNSLNQSMHEINNLKVDHRNGRKKSKDTKICIRDELKDAKFESNAPKTRVSLKIIPDGNDLPDSYDDMSCNENQVFDSNHGSIENSNSHDVASSHMGSSRGRHYSISSLDLSINDDDSQNRTIRASPLTIPKASLFTVSRQPSKVTVASTSSKAGLGPVKSAKLKRLWPDSSVFSKRILKWCPPELVIEDFKIRFKGNVTTNSKIKLPVIPSSFRDASEMIKCMTPHILDEGLCSLQQEFLANSDRNGLWTRYVFSMQLRVSLLVI
jgi:hypothetical protein